MNKFSFSSSPAWSIAHRYGSTTVSSSDEHILKDGTMPGPGSYLLNRSNSKATPSWKSDTVYLGLELASVIVEKRVEHPALERTPFINVVTMS
jgi:hypothetical protein